MLKWRHHVATLALNIKPCFIDAPKPRVDHFKRHVTNCGTLRLKIPGCECRKPTGVDMYYDSGQKLLGDAGCPCTISPCAADAFEQLQVQQIAHASNITQLESAIEDIKAVLAPAPDPSTKLVDPSLYMPIEITSVQAEVHKWLSLVMQ
jgi:hypothetical protein